MKLSATISVPQDDALEALLRSEEETFAHARASYRLHKGRIEIEAQDATALKATVSSVCRVLAVYGIIVTTRCSEYEPNKIWP